LNAAIETLTAAWSCAYKALGGSRSAAIPTIDLLTGCASTFGAGLDAWRAGKAAAEAAEAEGEVRRGLFSKGGRSRVKGGKGEGAGEGGLDVGDGGSVSGEGMERKRSGSLFKKLKNLVD